jgi:UDP-glucose:(heptosyl)LPS alpha-1,3-glucosyltransferase
MKIAFVARRYDRLGGTEADLYHLTGRLATFGHEVSLFCQEVRALPAAGVAVKKVPPLGVGRLARLWGLAWLAPELAYRTRPDLVVSFTRSLKQDIVRCGGGTHRVFLGRMRSVDGPAKRLLRTLSPYHNSLLTIEKWQLQRGCRKVLAISGVVKEEIVSVYGVPANDIEVIYDGIDTERFHPMRRQAFREQVRSEFGIPERALLILFLGSGFKRKNLDTLLRAVALLRDPNVHCLLVGGDGQMGRYKRTAAELGLGPQVVFAGVRKEPERFYAAADLFVLPSLQEPFGNVFLEAMASGLPVIATAVAGASELLTDELKRFVLADPLDAPRLAHLVSELFDPDVREKVGARAREIAEAYSIDNNARAIERFCQTVLAAKQSRANA